MFIIHDFYTKGESEEIYKLNVFPIPYKYPIPPEWEGVYMFAKQGGEFILVGSGNIKSETDRLIKDGNVMEKGATQILIYIVDDLS